MLTSGNQFNKRTTSTNLEALDFTLLRAQLLPPTGLGFGKRLDTRLELVNLPPPTLELLSHVVHPIRELALGIFTPLVKVQLDLA